MVLSPSERKKTIALIDIEINSWKFYQRCLSSTSSTGTIFKIIHQYLPSLKNFHSHASCFLHKLKMQMFPKFKSPERMAAKLWKFDHQHFTLMPTNGEISSSTRQHLPFFFQFSIRRLWRKADNRHNSFPAFHGGWHMKKAIKTSESSKGEISFINQPAVNDPIIPQTGSGPISVELRQRARNLNEVPPPFFSVLGFPQDK